MTEEYVSFELAKKLKEKGFDMQSVDVHGKFDTDGLFHSQLYVNYAEVMDDAIIAPSIAQVLKWLIKEKHLFVEINLLLGGWSYVVKEIIPLQGYDLKIGIRYENSYEEAVLAGIEYVLDNLI